MKIIITKANKLGIMDLRGMKSYMELRNFDKGYVVVESSPHPNVSNFAKEIGSIEIIEGKDYKTFLEEIKANNKEASITEIDLYSISERRFASDVD